MINVNLQQDGSRADIHVIGGKITGVSGGFTALTGFSPEETLDREIGDVLKTTLRLSDYSCRALAETGRAEGYIFTSSREPREVVIKTEAIDTGGFSYTLTEKPDSRVDDALSILVPLFGDAYMSVAVYSVPDLVVLKANGKYKDFLCGWGVRPSGVVGTSIREKASVFPELEEILTGVCASGKYTHIGEKLFIGPDGGETYRTYTLKPIYIAGCLKYIFEVSKDVTRDVKSLQLLNSQGRELKLQNEKLEAIIENMSDPLLIIDRDGRFTTVNKAARRCFENAAAGNTGDEDFRIEFTDIDDAEHARSGGPVARLLRGEAFSGYKVKTRRGEESFYFDVTGTPIFDGAGRLALGILCCRDISESCRHMREMSEKNEMLSRQAKLLDLSNEAIFAWELDGPIVYWNKGAERMYGYNSRDAVGRVNVQLLKTDFLNDMPDIRGTLLSRGEWQGLLRHSTKDGKRLVVESRIQLITDESGLQLALETNRDVTERQRMEDELREREFYLRIASEASGAGVFTIDHQKKRIYHSEQYKKILGLGPDDDVTAGGEFSFTYVHPDDREELIQAILAANDPAGDGDFEHEYRIIRPDKSVRWVYTKGQVYFQYADGVKSPALAAGVIIDVTEEKKLMDKLRQVSDELTNIIESTDDYVFAVGTDERVRFCNTAAKRFFREHFGKEIAVDRPITELVPLHLFHPFKENLDQLARGTTQFDFRTPGGGKIISYALNPVHINDELVEITVFGKDVTEHRNAEREILRMNALLEARVAERTAQLEQSVADLKNIALVLSHDLKSALRGISMYAMDISEGKDVAVNAQKIRKQGDEILSMIEGLMKFERSSRLMLSMEEVNLKKMTASVFNELNTKDGAPKGRLEFETGLPVVKADKELIRHVVMNILSNALKFTKPGVQPRITVGCRRDDKAYVFYYKDNGVGFNTAYADKVFGVFERLHSKNEYEGSGVGLAIVRNIVQRHGGRVWVESEEGIGTTVYFSLPAPAEESGEGDDHV